MMTRLGILLGLVLGLPGGLRAQEEQTDASRDRVGGVVSAVMKAGETAGTNRVSLGGWAGVTFLGNIAIGGGGFALSKDVELAGSGGDTGFNLDMGYGGLVFRFWEPLGTPFPVR
jgi:hypothetical protein